MMQYDEFRAMNSEIIVAAEGDPIDLRSGFERVRGFIHDQELRFTRFSDESELMRLNRAAGRWFRASADLFEIVEAACRLHAQTGGLFNPAVLTALQQAGYDRSFDQLGDVPTPSGALPAAAAVPDLGWIEFDAKGRRIRLPAGVQLDLGGIAKGWIAERAPRLLADYTQVCAVSAGGDMFMIGLPTGESAWQVALEGPRDRDLSLAVLHIGADTAVATSSVTRRRWITGGRPRHHLIDPRSGEPTDSDWLSVTVVSSEAAEAEAMAKALLIAGSASSSGLRDRDPKLVMIAVDRSGVMWGTPNAKELLNGWQESQSNP